MLHAAGLPALPPMPVWDTTIGRPYRPVFPLFPLIFKYKRALTVIGQASLRAKQPLISPWPVQVMCGKIVIVVSFPAGFIRKHQIINPVCFKHGQGLPARSNSFRHQFCGFRTCLIQPVNIPFMGQQINRIILICEGSYVPKF